jgi:hypothetical protein
MFVAGYGLSIPRGRNRSPGTADGPEEVKRVVGESVEPLNGQVLLDVGDRQIRTNPTPPEWNSWVARSTLMPTMP